MTGPYAAPITDFTPLTRLTNLQALWLGDTQVADLAPLAQLTKLQRLALSCTEVADAAPLAGLTNLRELPHRHAGRRRRPARTPHQPATLDLSGTPVADAAPLARLTNLQRLDLAGTRVADARPARTASPTSNGWTSPSPRSPTSPRSHGLTDLQQLDLSRHPGRRPRPARRPHRAATLDLSGTQVADLAPLAGLTGLQRLGLSGTQVADLAPLAGLTGLQRLDLAGTQVADLRPARRPHRPATARPLRHPGRRPRPARRPHRAATGSTSPAPRSPTLAPLAGLTGLQGSPSPHPGRRPRPARRPHRPAMARPLRHPGGPAP